MVFYQKMQREIVTRSRYQYIKVIGSIISDIIRK